MRVGLIGGGAMGEAIVSSLLKGGVTSAAEITVADVYRPRLDYLEQTYGVRAGSHADAAADADFLVLAVKPQEFAEAAADVGAGIGGATAVSIMAGVTIATISSLLRTQSVVRAMPNTPAQIGEGMTAWTATSQVGSAAREGAQRIFAALGKEAYVPEERYLDMVTALSGSGPAYVLLFIEALIDAGVYVGLSRDLATKMALQTVIGTARYAENADKHPAELRNQVTSPGGTTAEALRAFEAGGFRSAVLDGVVAAYEKSRWLGGAEAK
jgi:pyrroline-5-carboxylate reductase